LNHTFILLALNQNFQAEIHAEIDSAAEAKGEKDFDYNDYLKFRYIMAATVRYYIIQEKY